MDRRLLEAAISGDATEIKQLALDDPSVLLGITPQGNTCLHIASIHGHEGFCKDVLALNQSVFLLTAINKDGETPLLTAVARGRDTLAFILLRYCRDQQLSETILNQDKRGCNALHHAIFRGHRKLALELIEAEPALSKAVTKRYESPMFIAVMRGYGDVLEKLLEILDAAHGGARGYNALHAAVTSGNAGETYAYS
jgi:ankyrin repeat protein